MSSPISPISPNRAGLCPHGLPPAACPICSGGGMSGGARTREPVATKPMNSGEWSYAKCVAVGLQMQAQESRVENAKQAFERQIEFAKQLGKTINNIAENIKNAIQNFQNTLPNALKIPMEVLTNLVITPLLNLVAQVPKVLEKLAHFQKDIREFIQQAGEKLVAILGEIKNFVDKKVMDKIKKKVKSIFEFFISDFEGENYSNDDALAVFKSREIRKHLKKILKVEKKRDDDVDRRFESKTVSKHL